MAIFRIIIPIFVHVALTYSEWEVSLNDQSQVWLASIQSHQENSVVKLYASKELCPFLNKYLGIKEFKIWFFSVPPLKDIIKLWMRKELGPRLTKMFFLFLVYTVVQPYSVIYFPLLWMLSGSNQLYCPNYTI